MRARKKQQIAQQIISNVSKILSSNLTFSDALKKSINEMCKQLGWPTGSFWRLDEENDLLFCEEFYSSRPCPNFEAITRSIRFRKGEGLPGTAWRSNSPKWLEDVSTAVNFPRKEHSRIDALHAGFAFPVKIRGKFIGVFEFFSDEMSEPDDELLDTLAIVGVAIGEFFERNRYELELAYEAKLNEYAAEIGSTINKLSDLSTILQSCAEITLRYLSLQNVHICVMGDADEQIVAEVSADRQNKSRLSLINALDLNKISNDSEPYVVKEVSCSEVVRDGAALAAEGIKSFSINPLILDDKNFGFMAIFANVKLHQSAIAACSRVSNYIVSCVIRKRFEESLIASEKRFRVFADNVDQCLFISAPRLTDHYYVSPAFESIWGEPVSEVYANPALWAEFIIPEHKARVLDYCEQLKGYEMPEPEIEYQIQRADGKMLWLYVRIFAVLDHKDGTYRICGSVTDVTQRRSAEKRVSDFYLTVSHELRTPLTSIKGALLLLERRHSENLSEKGKQLSLLARKECDRLIRLISDMLDFKKIEAGMLQLHLEIVDPAELITQTEALLSNVAAEKGIELVNQVQTKSRVTADKDRIVQVLTNLISNAIKFSPDSSKILTRVEDLDSMLRFSVIDSGCGISPQDQGKLFTVFQQISNQENREGTGLGLVISKGIINEHGGRIGVVSDTGKGATFWFELLPSSTK